jgi:hypothetical protein
MHYARIDGKESSREGWTASPLAHSLARSRLRLWSSADYRMWRPCGAVASLGLFPNASRLGWRCPHTPGALGRSGITTRDSEDSDLYRESEIRGGGLRHRPGMKLCERIRR